MKTFLKEIIAPTAVVGLVLSLVFSAMLSISAVAELAVKIEKIENADCSCYGEKVELAEPAASQQ